MRKTPSGSRARKKPTIQAIRRAVASSTAIETGQSVDEIERKLKAKPDRFRHIHLASR